MVKESALFKIIAWCQICENALLFLETNASVISLAKVKEDQDYINVQLK